jgi:hypothetical protein
MPRKYRIAGALCLVAAALLQRSQGQEQKPVATAEVPKRIVPVIAVKPGETKEQLMCCACTFLTRGGGLRVAAMDAPNESNERTIWKGEGVTVEVPRMGEATAAARAPAYQPLLDKGLNAFAITVTAAKDARPRLIEIHLADLTCSGTCETDLRVLVIAK